MGNNITQNINKVLFALQRKGFFYRVNTINFYSEKSEKYCKKYELYIKFEYEKYNENKHEKEKKKRYIKVLDTFNKVELLKYLVDELKEYSKETGGDADVEGEINS